MAHEVLSAFGAPQTDGPHIVRSPIDGAEIGRVAYDDAPIDRREDRQPASKRSASGATCRRPAAANWCACSARNCAPTRRSSAVSSRSKNGKILQEGLGEVQEMIDICDFAVGLSRQLYGLTIASERPGHRMMETWHPAGPVAVDLGVQFSRRGVGLERGARACLRRQRDLEAVGENAADRAGVARAVRTRAVKRSATRRRTSPRSCSARAKPARRWRRIRASPWSARQDRRAWGANWRRLSRRVSARPFSNLAATMR